MSNSFDHSGSEALKPRGRAIFATLAAILMLSACAKDADVSTYLDPTEPADKTYNEALANVDAGNFTEARKKFKKVDRQHPYSPFAKKSIVMNTFISYRQGNYPEAIASGKRFASLYPSNSEAPYALYLVGMSYFRQISDVTRDQKMAANAYRAMNEVVTRYPESVYVEDAKKKMRVAKDQLAGKEMLVGRYYLERKEYVAAINRFRTVLEKFDDTRHVEESLARLTESYYALGLTSEAQTAAAVLGHNFPESRWYRDSYALLQTGGLRPEENQESWISRIGKTLVGAG